MKISYLITTHDETDTLGRLLYKIGVDKLDSDEVIIIDDMSTNIETLRLLNEFNSPSQGYYVYKHPLNYDYGSHKNYGIEKCSGDYIIAIDGDELLPETLLGESLHELIESNPDIEAYAVPRINDFRGVLPEDVVKWGWRLDNSPTYNRPRVNFPDFQWRIFKNIPSIRFRRKLHEKIEGYKRYSFLPAAEEYAIYHDKTIETQRITNERYNQQFSKEENMGHSVK